MKKIICLIIMFIVIFVTGCTKEYNLIIEDDKIIEEFNIISDDNDSNQKRLNLDYFPLHANESIKYKKTINKKDSMLNAHFNYTYKPSEFVNANTINECFDTKEIIVDNDKYYYFKLENMKECMSDYNLDINIITKNKVLENNADEISNDKYTWHMTDDNKSDFKLEIKVQKQNKKNNDFGIVIIVGIILVFIIVIGSYLSIKKIKSNKI